MCEPLIRPSDLDARLRYPAGRSLRLARKGLIPHFLLPDGEIRFDPDLIKRWLQSRANAGSHVRTVRNGA